MICGQLGAIPRPLGEVGAEAVEWTSERVQALIYEHNTVALQWLRVMRVAQAHQAAATTAGMLPFAAAMAQYAARAHNFRENIRGRMDFLYEVADLFGVNRWDSQRAVILEIRARAARYANDPQSLGLGVLPAAVGLVGILAAMVVALRWMSLQSQVDQNKMDVDVRRFDAVKEYAKRAEDPKLNEETRAMYRQMAQGQAEALQDSTPDIGAEKSAASDMVFPLALLAVVLIGGKKLLS